MEEAARQPSGMGICSEERLAALYRGARRSRSALAITETELKLMAALASMGLNSHPSSG